MAPAVGAWVLTLSLATCWFWPGAEAACYYPSGRLSPNDTPCRDDTPHATCCGQGYACLSNGMCQATGEELVQSDASEFVRGACTDKSWRSSSCPLFCIEEDVDFLDGGNGIAKCPNTSEDLYFCINSRSAEEASCEENRKLLFFAGTPSAITTIGVAASSTSSSSTSTTAESSSTVSDSSSTTSDPDSSTSQDSSTSTPPGQNESGTTSETPAPDDDTSSGSTNIGAIVGGVVGGAVVVILAALGGWLLARKRWATRANGPSGPSQDGNGNSYGNSNDHGYEHSYGNATSAIAPSSYQPPGEQKLPVAFTETHVPQEPYRDEAYQAYHHHVPPPGGWSPEAPSGPYELALHEAPPPQRGQAMELSVDRPLELPAGHR